MRKIRRVIIHHTAGSLSDTLQMVREWHKAKGFTDEQGHSGYHYFIDQEGVLFTDRPEEEMGCAVKNANHDSISIALAGNFNFDHPTNSQINTLLKCLISLVRRYNLKFWNIYGHKDIKRFFIFNTTATECPGNNLYNQLPDIRYRVGLARLQIKQEQTNDLA